ncbi:RNA polymerase sporulation sigma factor SigK [Ruminococcus gauvreauii]|uniref:RNA polymerase sporulation sigma factor SigK n=1 Tax=Ruminococcus gauvreauii TaxID=438033 RepID=A0ABY5VHB7_9FIRM|nr:RNA polymerase sporulation sigma factor SigK [Ruminococcus gauvreauii]UWP58908.1 RNA polymerase sporulation sigma factor SigK [Ruminococcus gauvreauii]
MKTFQKPLTIEEERQYFQKYKQGDMDAKNILIERNLRLVAHIVKKYQGTDTDTDDLISIGTIGLIKAISTFDSDKGNRLATYAARCIENELLMMFRGKKKTSREVSLYEPIGTDKEGNEIHLLDIIESGSADAADTCALKEDIAKLYALMESALSEQEYFVLKLRYGLYGESEYTQKKIAEKMGISRSYVSRIEKNALLKLRRCFLSP